MASTPGSIYSVSPKVRLPTEHSTMEEDKASRVKDYGNNEAIVSASYFQKIVAELLGTYVLIFAGCGAALVDEVQRLTIVGVAIVWGLVLMAMIYAVGHISGAHFNPAVTCALAVSTKFPWKHVPVYVLSQIIGATLASLTLKVLFHDLNDIQVTTTQYKDTTSHLEAIVWEFIITFTLMFTICGVATDHRVNKEIGGVAIGATLLFNVMIAGPITGASMNPARSIGPAVASGVYKNLWVFIVAPIFGACAAAMVYSVLRVPKAENSEEITKNAYNDAHDP
ncbi:aquaporin NIP1-1-like [Rhodamnia argentea]|uniref:Aquaporin NIP1-1-like n=1 Tax=Rhodamnia argentea TaxID=178133 RepID=A0A8B8P0T4_9MYRT|nr:aquaporin NIP1-1-like [Rhodamnia argentea]